MEQYLGEKGLAVSYPLIIGVSLLSSVTSAIAWTHWKNVLNPSIDPRDVNHGCFLYQSSIYSTFQGGHSAYCYFAMSGLILPMIFAIIFGSYHVYRVCMHGKKRNRGTVHHRAGGMIVVTAQTDAMPDDTSPYYWIPASIISILMAIVTIAYASIYSDGYRVSCNQSRNELVKELHASGDAVQAILERLSCAAVFDFLDYMHRDIVFGRQRYGRINTASCLYLALISSWLAVFLWIFVTYINIRGAKKSRVVRI